LSKVVQEQIKTPSPIRQIMKMAERQNIINMGLDPDDIISFGGGWVNHPAPELLRQKYIDIASDRDRFHFSGGYSATLGDLRYRELIADMEMKLFNMKNIGPDNIIVGQSSTQLTHDMFITLAEPGEDVILLDPTYANYYGQMVFALTDSGIVHDPSGVDHVVPRAEVAYLKVLDTEQWKYMPDVDATLDDLRRILDLRRPNLLIVPSPDNPTSQIVPQKFMEGAVELCKEFNAYLVIDFAYKTQYFDEYPDYFSWSPNDYPNLVTIHSNSKWARSLGRRTGWIEASPQVIDGMERVQQCSTLCPDTLHQMAVVDYLEEALYDGGLASYLETNRQDYQKAAKVTMQAIDQHLGMRALEPQGGLYTCVDIGMDGDEFIQDMLKNTGVLFIPGGGFGKTLKNAIRVSYGPMVHDLDRIKEGMERVGNYLNK
ncbi:MAG: pyridoxal phosphate-dependent aminotransferase, partial [Thermoplasmata archaeon]|nr:pyridoxal phosphate-dependent aminotransferase [Thermoplasmata archaeon]